LPGDLRKLGYHLDMVGEGERILAAGIIERFVTGVDGAPEPLTEGSTRPVAEVRQRAGIVRVERWAFDLRAG
jgi:hypothetical protein